MGQTVDGYRFEEPLGSGGMAVVYAATHIALERAVAIKVIRPEITYHPVGVARFEREAKVAATLRHPGLMQVFDYGRLPDNRPYLVMRRLEGRTLRDALKSDRRWDLSRIGEALTPVAEALDAMHAQRLVHRDVKPDNIFLEHDHETGTEKAIVMDFGLATLFQDGGQHLTQQGMLLGTPTYLPPEASERDTREPAADVYALAVTLFELLVGRPPFRDRDPVRLMARRLVSDAPPPSSILHGIPPSVDRFFERALHRKPSKRFTSCGEMLAALRELNAPPASALTTLVTEDFTPEPSESLPELPVSGWSMPRVAIIIGMLTIGLWVVGLPPFRRAVAPEETATREVAPPPQIEPAEVETPATERSEPHPPTPEAMDEAIAETEPITSERSVMGRVQRRRGPPSTMMVAEAETEAETAPEPERVTADVSELLGAGRRALLRGRTVQARAAYRRATGVAPQNVDAWLGLGIASEELGDRLAARRALTRAQSLARSPRERLAIATRLARLDD